MTDTGNATVNLVRAEVLLLLDGILTTAIHPREEMPTVTEGIVEGMTGTPLDTTTVRVAAGDILIMKNLITGIGGTDLDGIRAQIVMEDAAEAFIEQGDPVCCSLL